MPAKPNLAVILGFVIAATSSALAGVGNVAVIDSGGETMLAIDNTAGVDSLMLTVDGRPVTLSAPEWLGIAVLPN